MPVTRARIVPDFPGPTTGPGGRIYVVKFGSGVVKVGRSTNVRQRARALIFDPFKVGITIVDGWCSEVHDDYYANEIRLILFCREKFGDPLRGRAEAFDADYEVVRTHAEFLTAARSAV